MHPLAALYDIHGNLPALEAVLADARASKVQQFVLGGDYALFGAFPLETVEALLDLPAPIWIRGNGERWTADPSAAPGDEVVQGAIAASRSVLGAERVAQLAALPMQAVVGRTRYCHGSPISDVRSFMPEPGEDEAELLDGVREPRIVFGHTHLPFARDARPAGAAGPQLVNPGSVGMPFDGDVRASYALLHEDGRVEHRRVTYDHSVPISELRERFGDCAWTETVARRIASAQL